MRGCNILINLLVFVLLLAGCVQQAQKQEVAASEDATKKCIYLCQQEKAKGTNLDTSPCIGNPIDGFNDWVCDIAHAPRQAIDNMPENQCSAFREGKAKSFVELDPECKVIKVYTSS